MVRKFKNTKPTFKTFPRILMREDFKKKLMPRRKEKKQQIFTFFVNIHDEKMM